MYSLSKKEFNNRSVLVHTKSDKQVFMSISNQICVTRKILLLHQGNSGMLQYLYFKGIVPNRMAQWISTYNVPENLYQIDMLAYLNKQFIKSASELYIFNNKMDSNVYRNSVTLGSCAGERDDDVMLKTKKYSELMAADYNLLDIWAEQTVEVSDINMRNRNQIPVWQKSMNIRNYDRSNQGFASNTPNAASLENPVCGYPDVMDLLKKMKDDKYAKDNNL